MIGNRADGARAFGGRIDDLRIYNRTLSAAEVFGLATLPTGDRAPSVNAGTNQIAVVGVPISLTGTATDDGLPNPPGVLVTTWSQVSGAGTATFGNTNTTSTTVTFDSTGVYDLRLIADDSQAQSASDVMVTVYASAYDAWAASYGLTGNAALPGSDPDGDGQNNMAEFMAGTNPTNSASSLRIVSVARQGNDVLVTWTTVGGMSYVVQSTGASTGGYFNSFTDIGPLVSVPGTGESTTNYLDAGGYTNGPSHYYRVRLGP